MFSYLLETTTSRGADLLGFLVASSDWAELLHLLLGHLAHLDIECAIVRMQAILLISIQYIVSQIFI
jgi:hypothetical protein